MSNSGRLVPWIRVRKFDPSKYFDICPIKASAVWWMYNESAKGAGKHIIARTMPKRFRDRWPAASNPKMIGKFLKEKKVARWRRGKDVLYEIVEPDLVEASKHAQLDRAVKGGGRKIKNLKNLYVKLAKCELCTHAMAFMSGQLVCNNNKCPAVGRQWNASHFADSVDEVVAAADRAALVREERLDQIEAIDVELNFWKIKKGVRQKEIAELNQRISELRQEIKSIGETVNQLNAERDELVSAIDHVGPLRNPAHGHTRGDNDLARLTSRLAEHIKKRVTYILVAAAGTEPEFDARKAKADSSTFNASSLEAVTDLKGVRFFIVGLDEGKEELLGIPDERHPRDVKWWADGTNAKRQPGPKVFWSFPLPGGNKSINISLRPRGEKANTG